MKFLIKYNKKSMNEVFYEISQWRICNVSNFTLPRSIKVTVTQSLDVGRSWEKVQIEDCLYAYYIFITWSLWLIRSSSRRANPPNLPDIWGATPALWTENTNLRHIIQSVHKAWIYGLGTPMKKTQGLSLDAASNGFH